MAERSVMKGGIIAAGAGSRLRQAGWTVPKPLVEVAGLPLIGRVIRNFRAAGITSLVIIFNEEERDCERWVRSQYPDLDLRIIVKTTASSLESFREVCAALGSGPALISTVDAWCSEDEFVAFVRAVRERPDATVLAVTPLVADERPLWAAMAPDGRITRIGGDSGKVVTAGMYAVPERVRRLPSMGGTGRLREFLGRLVAGGEPVYGVVIPNVVDVDRAEDVALAEAMVRKEAGKTAKPQGAGHMSGRICWGIFRERAHSPGREFDDAEILRLTGKHLEARGFQVSLRTPEEVARGGESPPPGIFLMCERLEIIEQLRQWELRGVRHVNKPSAILNTYRDRTVSLFAQHGVAFPASRLVATASPEIVQAGPVWVKRADVHNTQDGDVVFAPTDTDTARALGRMAERGIRQAVIQAHVPGDLIKFYGIGDPVLAPEQTPWFRWFYHKDQQLAGHRFDQGALASMAQRAAAAIGLEVYGGDAIATETGALYVIDLNAWPSFALYRDEASERIASYLAVRLTGEEA